MNQACEDCTLVELSRKDMAQHIIDMYHQNARYSALTILAKIVSYCQSVR